MHKHGASDDGTWFEALKDLTPQAIDAGVERLLTLKAEMKFVEFPPNCLQFRALCLSYYEGLRLPKACDAYQEILDYARVGQARWSHPLTKYIAANLSDAFFALDCENQRSQIFKDVYEKGCHIVRQGFDIPNVVLTRTIKPKSTPEQARLHVKKLREILGMRP